MPAGSRRSGALPLPDMAQRARRPHGWACGRWSPSGHLTSPPRGGPHLRRDGEGHGRAEARYYPWPSGGCAAHRAHDHRGAERYPPEREARAPRRGRAQRHYHGALAGFSRWAGAQGSALRFRELRTRGPQGPGRRDRALSAPQEGWPAQCDVAQHLCGDRVRVRVRDRGARAAAVVRAALEGVRAFACDVRRRLFAFALRDLARARADMVDHVAAAVQRARLSGVLGDHDPRFAHEPQRAQETHDRLRARTRAASRA